MAIRIKYCFSLPLQPIFVVQRKGIELTNAALDGGPYILNLISMEQKGKRKGDCGSRNFCCKITIKGV